MTVRGEDNDAPAPAPPELLELLARLRSSSSSSPSSSSPSLPRPRSSSSSSSSPASSSSSSSSSRAGELLERELASSSSSRQQRRARARAAAKDERAKRRAAFRASLEARGASGCKPRDFPARVVAGVRAIFDNRTGAEARRALARLPRDFRRPVEELARHPREGRELPATLHHRWSRWIVSCAWLVWALRRRSNRNGMRAVVDGYTQPMICGLFVNATTGEAYSRSRLFASSYRAGSTECGPMYALKRRGLLHYAQPRTWDASPRFIGPPKEGTGRRFAFGIFWIPLEAPSSSAPS